MIVLIFTFIVLLLSKYSNTSCCPAYRFGYSDLVCGDGSMLGKNDNYCGYTKCNMFGCNCKCRNAINLTFIKGDIIACFIGRYFDMYAYHVMLGIDNSKHVIHLSLSDDKQGIIKKELFQSVISTGRIAKYNKHCQIVTNAIIKHAKRANLHPFSIDKTISRAFDDVNNNFTVEYNLLNANCEHLVTYWMFGVGFNMQRFNRISLFINNLLHG
jgi:hypothetical protein